MISDIDDTKAPLVDHLIELRRRLLWCVAALMTGFFICLYFAKPIFAILVQPLLAAGQGKLIYTDIFEAFFVEVKVAFFAALMFSPLASLQQLGFSLVLGITVDALLVRPLLVPCGHWLMNRHREPRPRRKLYLPPVAPGRIRVVDS